MGTDHRPGLEVAEVQSRILAFVQRELVGPEVTVGRDDELLSGTVLDSLGALRLAAFVQEEFQFKMPPADFVITHFRTVAALAEYIRSATGRADWPPTGAGR